MVVFHPNKPAIFSPHHIDNHITAIGGRALEAGLFLEPKVLILATDYRQHLRIGPITPRVRIGIENPCVGGSIPPQATSMF